MSREEYIVLDIETTGLSRYMHRITEIAAVKVRNEKVIDEFQTLVNPQTHIPRFITTLTGIDNKMVKDAPTIKEVLPEFLNFLGSSTIIAHNATFDYGFIYENAKQHLGVSISNENLCTRKLANRLLPDLPSKRLSALCKQFRIRNRQEHRAMGDAKATKELFSKMKKLLERADVKGLEEIKEFERKPRKTIILKHERWEGHRTRDLP